MRDSLKAETVGTGKAAAISLAIAQTLPLCQFQSRVKVYHELAILAKGSRQILSCYSVFGQVDVWQVVYCWANLLAAQKLDMSVGEKIVGTAIPRPKATIASKFFVVAQPFGT